MDLTKLKTRALRGAPYLFACLALLLFIHNTKALLYDCFHALDFSIYYEAITDIIHRWEANPYSSVRGVRIFNDHFDPIIYLASPFMALAGYHPLALIVFDFAFFAGLAYAVHRIGSKRDKAVGAFLLCMLFFNKPVLSGLLFPIHPSFWAIVPMFFLSRAIIDDRERDIYSWSACLMLFKEIFPIAILALAACYFLRKQWRRGGILALLGLPFFLVGIVFRKKIFGATIGYTNYYASNPIDLLWQLVGLLREFAYVAALKDFGALALALFFLCKDELRGSKRQFFAFLSHPLTAWGIFMLPLLAIHVIPNLLAQHREAMFGAAIMGVFASERFFQWPRQRPVLMKLTALVLLLTSMGTYTKVAKLVFLSKNRKCEISAEKRHSQQELQQEWDRVPVGSRIISTGGVLPRLMRPGYDHYLLFPFERDLDNYDYLLLETNGSGDTHPFSKEEVQGFRDVCVHGAKKVLLDQRHYFLAQGPFSTDCLKVIHSKRNWSKDWP